MKLCYFWVAVIFLAWDLPVTETAYFPLTIHKLYSINIYISAIGLREVKEWYTQFMTIGHVLCP